MRERRAERKIEMCGEEAVVGIGMESQQNFGLVSWDCVSVGMWLSYGQDIQVW
jgi:hypothetical protein